MTERLDDVLRDALSAEVSDVEAPDGGIRRVRRLLERRRRRQRGAMLAAAAAVVAIAAIASLATLRGGDGDSPVIADEPTTTQDAIEPTTTTEPTTLKEDQARAAEAEVRAFLDDLGRGDLDAAQDRLSSYAFHPAAELATDPVLSRLASEPVAVTVTPSWSFTDPAAVVTASTALDADGGLVAAAFLVDARQALAFGGGPIHRVQTVDETPEVGAAITPGEPVVISGTLPVEGGGRAFLGDREVPLEVDLEDLVVRVTYPADATARILTISVATPELPTAIAFVLDVTR